MRNHSNHSKSKPFSRDTIIFAVIVFLVAQVFMYYYFNHAEDGLSKVDLLEFIAVVVTCLSLVVTLYLAVLAVNILSYVNQIQHVRQDARSLREELLRQKMDVDAVMGLFPAIIEAIIEEGGKGRGEGPVEGRDFVYYRLVHSRLFLKLLITQDIERKIDICRDIVGSMQVGDSRDLLEQTLDILSQLKEKSPEDRDIIDPLIRCGADVLSRMPFERYLDHKTYFRYTGKNQDNIARNDRGKKGIFSFFRSK